MLWYKLCSCDMPAGAALVAAIVQHELVSIRESVDSLCRDGADAQYMQYLSKSHITSPQVR